MKTSSPPFAGTEVAWTRLISEQQWAVFNAGSGALEAAGVRLLVGGAMALAHYTQRFRNTKDIDVIIHPRDREHAISALLGAGFEDYFGREAYDRSWIFRTYKDGIIFDVIWDLPNHRVAIDEAWFERAQLTRLRDRDFLTVPLEELIRVKLYVFQRARCDWIDILNLLATSCTEIDWSWLVARMGRDLPLLHGLLAVFNWMCPERGMAIPPWLRQQFALPAAASEKENLSAMEERRVRVLDSRAWFAPFQPLDQLMQL